MDRRTALWMTLTVLSSVTLVSGCLGATVYTVQVSTAYDPQRTPEADRGRAQELGFRDDDPATLGDPEVVVSLDRGSAEADRPDDAVRDCPPSGEVTVPLESTWPCVRLDGDGKAFLQVQVEDPTTLVHVSVAGPAEEDSSGCRYGETDRLDRNGIEPDLALDGPIGVTVPYGIRC